MITADTDNAPDWVDLTTPDLEAATRFYSKLFNWDLERSTTPMGDYYIARQHGHQAAGLMAQDEQIEGPPVWTLYINCADVDVTVERASAAGGEVLQPPFDIPDGRVAIVADPGGAMFGLIATPLQHSDQRWFSHESGAVCWVEIVTRDTAGAVAFYTATFGWEATTSEPADLTYTTFKLNGEDVAGVMSMPSEAPSDAPSHWAIYFAVEDCASVEAMAAELGGEVLRATSEKTGTRTAVLADPQGASFHIMEYRS